MIDANFKSTMCINNSVEIARVTVTPILYLSNGKKVTLALNYEIDSCHLSWSCDFWHPPAQTVNDPESVIKRMIDTGFLEGHDQKVVGRLGDAGAVLVTKILAGRDLTSNTSGNAVLVIEELFVDPSLVETASDRQPRTSLFILKYLDLSTNDAELKKHIGDTRNYILDRCASSLQAK